QDVHATEPLDQRLPLEGALLDLEFHALATEQLVGRGVDVLQQQDLERRGSGVGRVAHVRWPFVVRDRPCQGKGRRNIFAGALRAPGGLTSPRQSLPPRPAFLPPETRPRPDPCRSLPTTSRTCATSRSTSSSSWISATPRLEKSLSGT